MTEAKFDLAIVGGGLAGGLIALALARTRPELRVALIDSGAQFGGNHIWSYHSTDIAPEHRWLTAPLVTHGWSGYDVFFPGHERLLDSLYYTIESERLDWLIRDSYPRGNLFANVEAVDVTPRAVTLADQRRIRAKGVIDARGGEDFSALSCGWQKFAGHLLRLEEPHDLKRPVIMDATVEQIDGFRFVYCLPFGPDRIFVEDTYYSDSPDLNPDLLGGRIAEYAAAKGWSVERIERQESGVLPVLMGGEFESFWQTGQTDGHKVAKAGARAALFHPLTSYSLPDAVRTAMFVAEQRNFEGERLHHALHVRARQHWEAGRFYRLLARLLFRAGEPELRYKLLERFYRLGPDLIARLYAGRTTRADMMRILVGRPPVPFWSAVKLLRGN